jgi:hypothetical protein
VLFSLPFPVDAQDSAKSGLGEELHRRYVLGIAAGLERFDMNIKLTNRESGSSIFVDAESSFGLPETQLIPIVYGAARINRRHGIGFYAFAITRTGDSLSVNEDFGRLQVDGRVELTDKSSFGHVNYTYGLFDDGQTWIRAMLGIYAIDLKMEIEATGQVLLDGVPVDSGVYKDTIDQFAPLPLIGLDYWSRVTDKWYFGAKLAFISGSYDDVSAHVVDANIRARYVMTSRVALITGVNYLSADVEIKRSNSIRDIRYGYDGVYLGLDFNF